MTGTGTITTDTAASRLAEIERRRAEIAAARAGVIRLKLAELAKVERTIALV